MHAILQFGKKNTILPMEIKIAQILCICSRNLYFSSCKWMLFRTLRISWVILSESWPHSWPIRFATLYYCCMPTKSNNFQLHVPSSVDTTALFLRISRPNTHTHNLGVKIWDKLLLHWQRFYDLLLPKSSCSYIVNVNNLRSLFDVCQIELLVRCHFAGVNTALQRLNSWTISFTNCARFNTERVHRRVGFLLLHL